MDCKELIEKLRKKDGCHCECLMAADAIETLLAERDAPVVHGRWESHLMPLAYKCSVCGYRPSAKEWRFHKRNFCPNCGAKMDLPEDGE